MNKSKWRKGSSDVFAAVLLLATNGLASPLAHGQSAPTELSSLMSEAELGGPTAQERLGLAYARGDKLPLDRTKAVFWLNRSASQGNPSAQLAMSRQLADRTDRPSDLTDAYKWALIAAKGGNDKIQGEAADMLDSLARNLSPLQIADARNLAIRWTPTPEVKLPAAAETVGGGTDMGSIKAPPEATPLSAPVAAPKSESVRRERPEQRSKNATARFDRKLRQIEYQVRVGVTIVSRAFGF
jgi:Sel1 repeat-containing protein